MTPKEFADIAAALAWPLIAVLFLVAFFKPVWALLDRLASTLTVKVVKLKAFGAEVELTPEQAKRALDELLQEIADSTNELTPDEATLFARIIQAEGRTIVADLFSGFARDSEAHRQLRRLRDRKLIRPFEGGNWQPGKHPVASRFGQLVYELKTGGKGAV
jgi:hypothetical protein